MHDDLRTRRQCRTTALAAIAGLFLSIACSPAKRPLNLIVVLVDTTRADHLGTHGSARPTSPRVDALAADSVVFTNHHSHSSRTGPSVASLFTGLHPRSHGVVNPLTLWDAKGTLSDENTTLAERLTSRGYRCYGIVGNPNAGSRFGFGQGFEAYELLQYPYGQNVLKRARELDLQRTDAPFFLYLHYMEPHSPYATPAPFRSMFADSEYDGPITGAHEQLDQIVAGEIDLTDADREQVAALYDQEIRYFDDQLGELLAWFDQSGLLEDSILVFVADHGEELFDHGSVLHGYTLYEEQLHVPLMIRDPRRPEARRVDAVTRHVDVLPTLLELLDLPLGPPVQGTSLSALMDGAPGPGEPRPVFAQSSLRAVKTVQANSLMIDNWKLIETRVPEPASELFDLARDPLEQKNLIETEPGIATRMREQLHAFESSLPVGQGGVVELTDEEIEQLRALGYVK